MNLVEARAKIRQAQEAALAQHVQEELERREQQAAAASQEIDELDGILFIKEEEYQEMVDALKEAMRVLGFYGDAKLSGSLSVIDRRQMLKTADTIQQLLGEIGEEDQ